MEPGMISLGLGSEKKSRARVGRVAKSLKWVSPYRDGIIDPLCSGSSILLL